MANFGRITQVIGPVVDVAFDEPGTKLLAQEKKPRGFQKKVK
jgi:F0F1-type ATP synthase beta subunit